LEEEARLGHGSFGISVVTNTLRFSKDLMYLALSSRRSQ
jgi:hypothetical protein